MGGTRHRGEGKAAQGGLEEGGRKGGRPRQGGNDYGLLLLRTLGILGVKVSSDSFRYPAPFFCPDPGRLPGGRRRTQIPPGVPMEMILITLVTVGRMVTVLLEIV